MSITFLKHILEKTLNLKLNLNFLFKVQDEPCVVKAGPLWLRTCKMWSSYDRIWFPGPYKEILMLINSTQLKYYWLQ
jgi:hypothetical protein